ncbi:MAG: nickel pincer cofactor biosynthesis protein LarC [Bacteroidales bacterium]
MKIVYYDCFSGISGDMNLGAMIDLGVSRDTLINGLEKLNIGGWRLDITSDQRHGITGTRVTVLTDEAESAEHSHLHSHGKGHEHAHEHPHRHDHADDHEHDHAHDHADDHEHNHEHNHAHVHENEHENGPGNGHDHRHGHRNLSDIRKIIKGSSLSEKVTDLAMRIFTLIAEAEAAVHDKPIDEIHFHEVGAIDSIVDIVGSAICYDALGVDRVYVSTVELGSGMVRCEHGLLPVPAPATARIIAGFPVHTGGVSFEATTPTGAAIIAALASPLPPGTKFSIVRTGYGIGQKNNPARPNILRVFLAETEPEEEKGHQALLVECNVDDMNPELSDYISAKLFSAGAGDVWFTPVIMKKGRPAFTISVICEEEHRNAVREILFTESTTIGLRVTPFSKETLHRDFVEIETRFGKVVIKKSYYKDRLVSVKPEADRCAAIAGETGLPMKQVIHEITAQALQSP